MQVVVVAAVVDVPVRCAPLALHGVDPRGGDVRLGEERRGAKRSEEERRGENRSQEEKTGENRREQAGRGRPGDGDAPT